MHLKGFNEKWIWIRSCISYVNYSVIINGKLQGKISAKRGICRADPLSPFLFVIVMDYLSRVLEESYKKGITEGFSTKNSRFHVSHLLFADDILLFSSPSESKMKNLNLLLKGFDVAIGLNINLHKSSLFGGM